MERDTINFEYWPHDKNEDSTPTRLSFDVKEGLHCAALHKMCKAFALALGYTPQTVERYFGEDSDDDWM